MTEQTSARSARNLGPTSPRSARVVAIRALNKRAARRESGTFLAEGPQSVREALVWGHVRGAAIAIYATQEAMTKFDFLASSLVEVTIVGEEILNAMADTTTPQGVIAICRLPQDSLGSVLGTPNPRLLAILANVRDPGNLGTVIRSADAAGADGVITSVESVDPWSPKAVRSSAGSLWHIPVIAEAELASTIAEVSARGFQIFAADADADVDLDGLEADGKLAGPTAWLFGNESAGLTDQFRDLADVVVSIPIFGGAESLNLSMAATLALYSSARAQRRA